MSPQKMPLWHKNYFKVKALKKETQQFQKGHTEFSFIFLESKR